MSDIEVSRFNTYTEADAERLGLLRKIVSPSRSAMPVPEEQLKRLIYYHGQRELIVARDQGDIVSSAVVNRIVSPDLGTESEGQIGWLSFVATMPDYRRRGIFEQVWQRTLQWCAEQGIGSLDFTSNRSRLDATKFYKEHGAIERDTTYFRVAVQDALARLE